MLWKPYKYNQLFYACIITILSFTCYNSVGAEKDSLISALKNHPANDTKRVELLSAIAGTYIQKNVDSMEFFASEGLSLAKKINFEKGIAICSRQLGIVYLHKHEFDKAVQHYNDALRIFEKTDDKPMQIDVLIYTGDIYYRDTKYSRSIEYYNRAIALAERTHDMKSQGLALIDIGGIYTDQSSFAEAIDYYLRGLKVFEEINDNKGMSMTLINIANIYSAMGNYKTAVDYINKSMPAMKGITDKEVIFSNMINAGVVYGQMKDYQRALDAFKKGMLIADSMGDKSWQNICLANAADIYYQMGSYDTAYSQYSKLLKLSLELNDTSLIPIAKTGLGTILIRKGKIREGINELLPALAIAQSKQIRQTVFDASGELSAAYEQLHDYRNALKYHKIYYGYRDSLNGDKNYKKIQQLQFDYELGKKETQIELLKKNRIIAEDRSDKQRIIIWSSLSAFALLVIICILLYRNSLHEKRNKEKILKQKEEIQLQATKLEELNRVKDKTFSVLSHDLRAPLGALTAAISMIDEKLITVEDFMTVKPEVQEKLGALNILLDNLLNWARSYIKGDLMGPPQAINICELVNNHIDLAEGIAAKKHITIRNAIKQSALVLGYSGQLDIVIRNLLLNAIKFSNDRGLIVFNAAQKNGSMEITITDQGVGMTQAQLDKLFRVSNDMSTYGTGGEKGVGIGLLLCYEFVKANNGTISASSEANNGATFTITLPAG
jgi:signal transduction histidine kinase/tetratricopeptide (TPR) repeat protein